jgi:transaldolase
LLAFGDHGEIATALPRDGGNAEAMLAKHIDAGIDLTALSTQLQSDGAKGFVKSWNELLGAIESKSKVLA